MLFSFKRIVYGNTLSLFFAKNLFLNMNLQLAALCLLCPPVLLELTKELVISFKSVQSQTTCFPCAKLS